MTEFNPTEEYVYNSNERTRLRETKTTWRLVKPEPRGRVNVCAIPLAATGATLFFFHPRKRSKLNEHWQET